MKKCLKNNYKKLTFYSFGRLLQAYKLVKLKMNALLFRPFGKPCNTAKITSS